MWLLKFKSESMTLNQFALIASNCHEEAVLVHSVTRSKPPRTREQNNVVLYAIVLQLVKNGIEKYFKSLY